MQDELHYKRDVAGAMQLFKPMVELTEPGNGWSTIMVPGMFSGVTVLKLARYAYNCYTVVVLKVAVQTVSAGKPVSCRTQLYANVQVLVKSTL